MIKDIKTNTYNPDNKGITISQARFDAITNNSKHYADIFSNGHEKYAIPEGALVDTEKLAHLNAFLF